MNKITKALEEQYRKAEIEVVENAKKNPLLSRHVEISSYYKSWIRDSVLVAIIPALPKGESSRTYYSVGTQFDDSIRVSPVFMSESFLFDSEDSNMESHVKANPVVLFFKGCDDGHVGLRFRTKEDAMEYVQCLNFFEEVFDDPDLQYHN